MKNCLRSASWCQHVRARVEERDGVVHGGPGVAREQLRDDGVGRAAERGHLFGRGHARHGTEAAAHALPLVGGEEEGLVADDWPAYGEAELVVAERGLRRGLA